MKPNLFVKNETPVQTHWVFVTFKQIFKIYKHSLYTFVRFIKSNIISI